MRFRRFEKSKAPEETPRRVAFAKRAIEKDREKCGLFPEMMRYETAEERLQDQRRSSVDYWDRLRCFEARTWRESRSRLNKLRPITRAGVLTWWQAGGTPGQSCYLADAITQAQRGISYWGKLAERRRLYLVGQGRLPNPWKKAHT